MVLPQQPRLFQSLSRVEQAWANAASRTVLGKWTEQGLLGPQGDRAEGGLENREGEIVVSMYVDGIYIVFFFFLNMFL